MTTGSFTSIQVYNTCWEYISFSWDDTLCSIEKSLIKYTAGQNSNPISFEKTMIDSTTVAHTNKYNIQPLC